MLRDIIKDRWFLILSFILVIISLTYPLTITFDTGHYMFLADVIKDGTWGKWDPIRGIIFPLFLNISTTLLGRNQNALLIPVIIAQLILFLLSIYLILQATSIKRPFAKTATIILVFLFIMVDPVIFGYYHTLLTEFFAATLAVISIYVAIKLYYLSGSLPELSKPLLVTFLYFFIFVPFAWHLKQPYVGTALIPFLLSSFSIIVRDFRKKGVLAYLIIANILIMVSLASSMFFWAGFLRLAGMPARPNREISGVLNQVYEANADTALDSPMSFAKYSLKNYFTLSNFFYFERQKGGGITIVKKPSLVRAFQNKIIAARMYDLYGQSNTFYMTDELLSHVEFLSSNYYPPLWFNAIQVGREKTSNFLFTLSFLLMPFIFLISTIHFIRKKDSSFFIIFVGSGSAFLNAVGHSIFLGPIDRYLFWGYPLNLLVIVIILIRSFGAFLDIFRNKRLYKMQG